MIDRGYAIKHANIYYCLILSTKQILFTESEKYNIHSL